jgi:hypothetical protein
VAKCIVANGRVSRFLSSASAIPPVEKRNPMSSLEKYSKQGIGLRALLLAAFVAGCGDSTSPSADPSPTTPSPALDAVAVRLGPAPVVLGAAATYVILAKSAVTNVPRSSIVGNIGLSPAAGSFITGFALVRPSGRSYATSAQVTGKVYAANYGVPTPANLTRAIGAMQAAYVNAAGRRNPNHTELYGGYIGGRTLAPGLYKWSTTVRISRNVTLRGGVDDVWIFQIAGGLTQASATKIILSGGAQAKNIFWQVARVVAIGTTAHLEGEVLGKTGITLKTGASVNGRLLAQTAVTLQSNRIVKR